MNIENSLTIRNIILPISSLFIAIAFLAIGYGMLMTFIGIYLKGKGTTDIMIGTINAVFFAGAIISSVMSQKIILTVGHIRSFSTFAAIMVVSFLLHALYENEFFWIFLRFISGFSYYGLLIILESWLNEKSDNKYRGQTLAIYSTVFYLSTIIGQFLLQINGGLSKDSIFMIGSLLVLISLVLISVTKMKEPDIIPFERYSLPNLVNVAPLALLGSFIAGFMVGGFFTMIPLYILNILDSVENLVIFMSLSLLGGLIAQFPIGKLSDHFGRRIIIVIVSAYISFLSIFFLFQYSSNFLVFSLGCLIGMGIFSLYPLSVARANDVNNASANVVEISRALLFIYASGSFLAPLLIGLSFNYFGYISIFVLYSFLGLVLFLFALTRERVPNEELTIFVEVPPVSGETLSIMDPRQDRSWVNKKSSHIND